MIRSFEFAILASALGDCDRLSHQVPLGAWLISRVPRKDKTAFVSFYDPSNRGVVLGTASYDVRSGAFIPVK